jgi:hypothetical protein
MPEPGCHVRDVAPVAMSMSASSTQSTNHARRNAEDMRTDQLSEFSTYPDIR